MLFAANYEWLKHFWPFHHPVAAPPDGNLVDSVKKAIEQAAELAYWSGVGHGFLSALIVVAVIGLVWWLIARPNLDGSAKATIIIGLLSLATWYTSSLQNKPPVPIPPTPIPKPAPDPRPPRRPHFSLPQEPSP